jgi:hypothetical protein
MSAHVVRPYRDGMTVFLVFRHLPGVTRDQYSAAQRAVADVIGSAGQQITARYLGGFFLPASARAICVFQAGSVADVEAVNEQAQVPFTEVVPALDLRISGS